MSYIAKKQDSSQPTIETKTADDPGEAWIVSFCPFATFWGECF